MRINVVRLLATIALVCALSPTTTHGQSTCRFVLGFAEMVEYVGPSEVGPCLENQRTISGVERFAVDGFSSVDVEAGASVQWTARGLLVWHPNDNSTNFYSRRGIWFRSPTGSRFVSMEELTTPASPTPTPLPAPQRPGADDPRSPNWTGPLAARCGQIAFDEAYREVPIRIGAPPSTKDFGAILDAYSFLCSEAAATDGERGVDCFERAISIVRGSSQASPGLGMTYDRAYQSCISRR